MGSVGPVLAAAFQRAGHTLVGVSARSSASRERADSIVPGVAFLEPADLVAGCDLVLLCVRDREIADLVDALALAGAFRAGQLVAHVSGAFGLEVLDAAARVGAVPLAIHPAQTFSGTSLDLQRLHGTHWAVSAPVALVAVAQALVLDLGGVPHVLPDAARPLYHAALAHGANHLVTLVSQSLRVLAVAGIDDPAAFAEPLLRAALERVLVEGDSGLSGPVLRGDVATVSGHLAALSAGGWRDRADLDPALPYDDLADVPDAYRAMARATAMRVHARGGLTDAQFQEIHTALN